MTICLAASLALAACAGSRAGTSAGGSAVPATPSTVVSSAGPPGGAPSSPAPSAPSAPVATARIVVTPVTEGRASPGWAVTPEPQTTIYCGDDAEPSPGALAPNIYSCSPSYAYAVACWRSRHAHHVLCLRDPWSHAVIEMPNAGRLRALPPSRHPTPVALQLSDGARCSIRNGGAWGSLKGHPEMWGTYSCRRSPQSRDGEETILWGRNGSFGINTKGQVWTVQESLDGGESGHTRSVQVRAAYYVGNAA